MTQLVIYCVENLVNGKKYVGKTIHDPEDRWKKHLQDARSGSGYLLHTAIRKYSEDKFTFRILQTEPDISKEVELEQHWIQEMKSTSFEPGHWGYNLTLGGEGTSGRTKSKEERDHLSKIRVERGASKGEKNPMYGKGDLLKGENNPFFGRKHSKDSKRRMSKSKKGIRREAGSAPKELLYLIQDLKSSGLSYTEVAENLNYKGIKKIRKTKNDKWDKECVEALCRRHKLWRQD